VRLLVDTHVLLWAIAEPERIPGSIRDRLESPDNDVFFSAASIWEVAIKQQVGRLKLPVTPEEVAEAAVRMGLEELPITAAHAAGVSRLPLHHRDPFDRLLIAQAIHEPARFLTADQTLTGYSDLVEMVR
jgi:PIN domain nuclease of toxin-antitoxin system